MGQEGSRCDWLVTHDPTETSLHRAFRLGERPYLAGGHHLSQSTDRAGDYLPARTLDPGPALCRGQ